jgi:hypothetical protein
MLATTTVQLILTTTVPFLVTILTEPIRLITIPLLSLTTVATILYVVKAAAHTVVQFLVTPLVVRLPITTAVTTTMHLRVATTFYTAVICPTVEAV